jgi:ribosome modulation factor
VDRKIVELLVAGKSVREIRELLRIGTGRFTKVKALAELHGYIGREIPIPVPSFPQLLFPDRPDKRTVRGSDNDTELQLKKEWILERLNTGWRPITIFEELGIPVTRSSFYRFLNRHGILRLGEANRFRVVPEIIHRPGEALILDWGKLRDYLDPETGKKKTVWAFVGTLGFSRFMMVRLVHSNDLMTTIEAIESMFREIGGVPERLTSDNPKCFAIEASYYEPVLNPGLELFLAHYSVQMECLPPRDPQKKGKVERMMPYVRRLYEAHGQERFGWEESQKYLDKKLELANLRIHGTTRKKPVEAFIEVELDHLKPLPPLAYEKQDYVESKVRQDGHVRFQNKYYSLEEKFINQDVFIIGGKSQISIYHKGTLIETHERLLDPYQSKNTKPHHLKPWEQAMQDDSHYMKRAAKLGPEVERLILILLQQGNGFIDTRKIWGILSFDKKYSAKDINRACKDALNCGEFSYRTVSTFLKLQSNPSPDAQLKENKQVSATNNKFVRPMTFYQEVLEFMK